MRTEKQITIYEVSFHGLFGKNRKYKRLIKQSYDSFQDAFEKLLKEKPKYGNFAWNEKIGFEQTYDDGTIMIMVPMFATFEQRKQGHFKDGTLGEGFIQ